MQRSVSSNRIRRIVSVVLLSAVATFTPTPTPALAAPASPVIVLPGAHAAEGIALGDGATFFAGDLFAGDIFRGDLQRGTAALFIDAPDGRQAAGMKYDRSTGLLFVAGAFTGQGYVYDTVTATTVAVYQFADPADAPMINDVALGGGGAWFTDSTKPNLYFVPIDDGVPGAFHTLTVTGPAAAITGPFNFNGIAATPDGNTLIVAHTANSSLFRVDPATGESSAISGVSVPNVDGIVLRGHRVWAVRNFDNRIDVFDLAPDLRAGVFDHTITNAAFEVPTTAALHGDQLGVVNAKFDTGFPPTASQYEVVVVRD